jgi:predicted nucleotidyltransferase component of viral defense system
LWPELAEVPENFVLYGGTALALRLGHRQSLDFDFFSSEDVSPEELLHSLRLLRNGKILQNTSQTLTIAVNRGGEVKLSFFGGLTNLGRVGAIDRTPDGVLTVASLLDLAGTKAAVITQRAETKDYIDMLAILGDERNGISLLQAMAAAQAIYGEQYNPMLTVKSLASFVDGDLPTLTEVQKTRCRKLAAAADITRLPDIRRLSSRLTSS